MPGATADTPLNHDELIFLTRRLFQLVMLNPRCARAFSVLADSVHQMALQRAPMRVRKKSLRLDQVFDELAAQLKAHRLIRLLERRRAKGGR